MLNVLGVSANATKNATLALTCGWTRAALSIAIKRIPAATTLYMSEFLEIDLRLVSYHIYNDRISQSTGTGLDEVAFLSRPPEAKPSSPSRLLSCAVLAFEGAIACRRRISVSPFLASWVLNVVPC